MAQGVHKITADFEEALSKYTGAPYVIAVDNCSNAIFLSLKYWGIDGLLIDVPSHTYPSVPCEVINAGGRVRFYPEKAEGAYELSPTRVYDSSLRFTYDMYIPDSFMCLSFTGPYKHLKLGKGGAILTDNKDAYEWLKRKRFSGRRECSYHEDELDMIGWNFYMMPEIAARGLLLMGQFYDSKGRPKDNPDLIIPYPDLSKFDVYGSYSI